MATWDRQTDLRWFSRSLHAAGLAVLAIATVLGYVSVIRPLTAQQHALTHQRAELDQMVDRAATIRQTHQELTARSQRFVDRMDAMRARIPDEPQEAEFLSQIAVVARQTGVAIQSYERGTTASLPDHTQLRIDLTISGTYANLCRFLDQMAQMPRMTTIEKMEVQAGPAAETLPVKLTLVLYYASRSQPPTEVTGKP